jgi:hypothetical protein
MNTLAREIMFRDAVNPSLGAAGNASLRFTPRLMIARHLVADVRGLHFFIGYS